MSHNHLHNNKMISGSRLVVTIILNFVITIAEIIGGVISGSLSLISDALHNFSDGIAVIISYFAIRLKSRPHTEKHTFGFKRAEILAALINSAVLVAIAFYLFYESISRLLKPEPVEGALMTIVAAIGLVANIIGTFLLKGDSEKSINIKSAYLHLFSDAISSAAVIVGGVAIYFYKIYWLDPILTILIAIYVLKQSFGILTDTLHILMEGTPENISMEKVKKQVEQISGVVDIHHLHIWSVGDNDIHLEAHINITNMMTRESDEIRVKVENLLYENFNINHSTIQFECGVCNEVDLIANNK
jgi:cobalt-zinc-cadmium efflux system protein